MKSLLTIIALLLAVAQACTGVGSCASNHYCSNGHCTACPAVRHCPALFCGNATLKSLPDSNGCPGCPCCSDANGNCIVPCGDNLPECADGSYCDTSNTASSACKRCLPLPCPFLMCAVNLTSKPTKQANGCPGCPCCADATGECPVSCGDGFPACADDHYCDTSAGVCKQCIRLPCAMPMCIAGLTFKSTTQANGCLGCPCCADSNGDCAVSCGSGSPNCPTNYFCNSNDLCERCTLLFCPAIACPVNTTRKPTFDDNGCPLCPCCADANGNCPGVTNTAGTCTQTPANKTCASGGVVVRDPDNHCDFFPCPDRCNPNASTCGNGKKCAATCQKNNGVKKYFCIPMQWLPPAQLPTCPY